MGTTLRFLQAFRNIRSHRSPEKSNSPHLIFSADLETEFRNNPLYSAIIESDDFRRLSGISFLGGLSYIDGKGIDNTRADHSIRVALLTYYFCKLSQFPERIEQLLVVSGLLHDIHHLPFSHTMENALTHEDAHFSLGYETKRIIFGRPTVNKSLGDVLRGFKIDWQALPILKPKSRRMLVFGSTHNVDTLDGILRAYNIFLPGENSAEDQLNQLPDLIIRILSEAEISSRMYSRNAGNAASTEVLDAFWELKNRVYDQHIYEPKRLLFERILGYYIFDLCKRDRLLQQLTNYVDEDFFEMFPKLREKINALWRHIESNCYYANNYSSQDVSKVLKCHISSDIPNSYYEPLAIPTRGFKVDKSLTLIPSESTSWRQRYLVGSSQVVFIASNCFISSIEEILESPFLWQRIQRLFNSNIVFENKLLK